MNKSEKIHLVSALRNELKDAQFVLITKQVGLTVSEVSRLRRSMKEVGATYRVVKNTLSRLSLEGTSFEEIKTFLEGPTALTYSQDPVSAAKALVGFSDKNEKITVVCGGMNGRVLTQQQVKMLAKLPSRDELRSQLIALISAPATKIARIMQEPAGQLARVISAHAEK